MSNPASPNLVELKVNKEMERFLLRSHTSNRQLLSKLDMKIVNTDLVCQLKFEKPKKVIIPEFKSPLILNTHSPTQSALPDLISPERPRKTCHPSVISSKPKTLFFDPLSSYPSSPQAMSSKYLSQYQNLIQTINKTSKKSSKYKIQKKNNLKIRRINRELKTIQEKLFPQTENKKINDFERKFEKQYSKQALKDYLSLQRSNSSQDYQNLRFSK